MIIQNHIYLGSGKLYQPHTFFVAPVLANRNILRRDTKVAYCCRTLEILNRMLKRHALFFLDGKLRFKIVEKLSNFLAFSSCKQVIKVSTIEKTDQLGLTDLL